jgi:hypothetical protein
MIINEKEEGKTGTGDSILFEAEVQPLVCGA